MTQFPVIMDADRSGDMRLWMKTHHDAITVALDTCGALLIRSGRMSEACFKDIVSDLSDDPLQYMYRSTPRTDLGPGIFTATEYPAGLDIPQHNENAYQREWPLRIIFYCDHPADRGGGQTPIANVINVSRRIDSAIWNRFQEKQVMYIRNFRPDVDLPWQTVFQTTSRTEVEAYCRAHEISFEWMSDGNLRTKQVCQAVARHPRKGVLLWFNQAHLFHPSALDPNTRQLMREMMSEKNFPRHATYGDGSAIDEANLQHIRDAFANETVMFQWQAGDLLLLDNMLVSHGRKAYKGQRRVLVAMYDLCSASTSPQPQKPQQPAAQV
jgi:alpha-ketoglutarate-dependent taurine dioxygenase